MTKVIKTGVRAFERLALAARAGMLALSGKGAVRSLAIGGSSTPIVVNAVFVQYDRKKYRGSLERFLRVLDRLDNVEYSVVVVDNARPGDWVHDVSERLVHIGGDNAAWEFSAFDRGMSFIENRGAEEIPDRKRLYVLVTDAFLAYGEDFLSLLQRPAFERSLASQVCIGWVDAWPQVVEIAGKSIREWLRTSFLILPTGPAHKLRPFAAPLDRSQLFSTDPTKPFLVTAPLSQNLREYLEQWLTRGEAKHPIERWHSQFELTTASLSLFQDKACAILREHLLSARLQELNVPCYDLRLLHELARHGVNWDDLDPATLRLLMWDGWRNARVSELGRGLRIHTERAEIPDVVDHGKSLPIQVEGWILTSRVPRWVRVGTSRGLVLHGTCIDARPDVLSAFPKHTGEARHFKVDGSLTGLALGAHDIELCFEGEIATTLLKRVQVVPFTEFSIRRLFLPDAWPAGQRLRLSIEGELCSSASATRVEVLLDDQPAELSAALGRSETDESGVSTQDVLVNGELVPCSTSADHHLEMIFHLADGNVHKFSRSFHTIAHNELPHTLRRLTVGPYRPDSGMTAIHVDLVLHQAEPGDRLVLQRSGIDVLEVAAFSELQNLSSTLRPTTLTLDREVDSVPPGASTFLLSVRRGSRRFTLFRGEIAVRYERPEIHLERLEASFSPDQGRGSHRLQLLGWVRNHFLVDCLVIEIDGSRASAIGLDRLRPDVAEAFQAPLVVHQGFDSSIDVHNVTPGEHVVHVVACQHGGETARVSQRVTFPGNSVGYFNVTSDDLELLLSKDRVHRYGSVAIRGKIESLAKDLVATLIVDGRRMDEQRFEQPGKHNLALRCIPGSAGEREVKFMVSSNGRAVYETSARRVHFQPVKWPDAPVRALGRFLDHFELRDRIVGLPSDEDLLTRLAERLPERTFEFFKMLAAVEARLDFVSKARNSERLQSNGSRSRSHPAKRGLRVLTVSWESPHRFHGGGVYLSNLIEHLGRHHEITVIHTRGVDEEGLADALRPSIRKLISIPRQNRGTLYRGDARLPDHLYHGYTPELRRAIELELQSGAYDLVDYNYTALGPYVVTGTPRVMTVVELGYTALLNTHFAEAAPMEVLLPELEKLLRVFHYNTVELPRLFGHLIALTEEDANGISTYCNDAKVFVNPPGVNSAWWDPRRNSFKKDAPSVVYVGNYQHPPNVYAATFFTREVMPLLQKRHPALTFRIVGSNTVREVMELDGVNGAVVVGRVEDVRPELWRASACVAPIFTGTGMRLKVLDALASGTPLVSTPLAVRGLALNDGKHYLNASTPQQFADAVSKLITDPNQANAMGREARRLVEREHDWERAARVREGVWRVALHNGHRGRIGTEANDRERAD